MIKIVSSGDYVQIRYVDTISEYVQEELKSDSDAIEYSSGSNGKIYLKFGRMTFEYADPTIFEINGSAVTDAADFITKLTALFSSSPGGGGVQSVTGDLVDNTDADNPVVSIGYLVYTALLTQSGTNAPTVDLIDNTIGDIVWTRDDFGIYLGTLTGAFVGNKVISFIQNNYDLNTFFIIDKQNDNTIKVLTGNTSAFGDDYLLKTSIEIRVYP